MNHKFLILLICIGILLPISNSLGAQNTQHSDHMRKYRYADTDMEHYKLGEKIYYNKVKLPEEPISDDKMKVQSIYLRAMTKGIPESVKKRIDKSKLAGRLDDKQLDALKYYLNIRFKQKYGR